MTKSELIAQLTESHVRFVDALINNDGELALLAYRNYTQALSLVLLERMAPGLIDVTHNAAGIDERWLKNASQEELRAALSELRRDARKVINS